jgi:hypothetical protein
MVVRFVFGVFTIAVFAVIGCSPRFVAPCSEARDWRAQANASKDGYQRSILGAKADAAEERCRQSGMQNSANGYEAEKRRHEAEAEQRRQGK